MVAADGVVERLRAVPAASVPGASLPRPPAGEGSPGPGLPGQASRRPARPRRLPARSVPAVLLALGALCLLVAGIVFVAVTWSLLGLTGRTLVLLGVTVLLGAAATVCTRRGLRGASETLWLVTAGMLAVDLLAAHSAGLAGLDNLGWRATGALVGLPLLVLGIGVGAWGRRQPVGRLVGAEVVAVLGAVVLAATNAWGASHPAVGSALGAVLAAALFVALRRRLPVTAYGIGVVAALSWAVLVGVGLAQASESTTPGEWWSVLHRWPLVVAAVLMAPTVHTRGLSERLRPVLAGLALVPLVILLNAPVPQGTASRYPLLACLTLTLLGLVARLAPRAWAAGAAVLAALGVVGLALVLMAEVWAVVGTLPTDGSAAAGLALPAPDLGGPAPWTSGVSGLALALTLGCLAFGPTVGSRHETSTALLTLAPAGLVLGALALVLDLEPPLWAAVLAAAMATAVMAGTAWGVRSRPLPAATATAATTVLLLVSLRTAAADHVLTAVLASVATVVLAAVMLARDRAGAAPSSSSAAVAAVLMGAYAVAGWCAVAGGGSSVRSVALAVYAATTALLAARVVRHPAPRLGIEAGSAGVALAAVLPGVGGSGLAAVLTVLGAGCVLVAVTTSDRWALGWAGSAVLLLATLVRIEQGVDAPEVYTLPVALLLLAAGAWRLRRDEHVGSFRALGSGLVLALAPSLLLALDEPVSVRGALVAVASVGVLAVGLRLRLSAPFVVGAVATALLAVRHLGPVAAAVPRWISLGAVGVLLLVVGITWESRRQDVRRAGRYLDALR